MTTNTARRTKRLTTWIGAAFAALLTVCVGGSVAVNQQEQPARLATALYGPGEGDANLLIYKSGKVVEQQVTYDKNGHGDLPKWEGTIGPFGPNTVPVAPVMGWNPPYVREVAAGTRPLHYCLDEVRQFDARAGTGVAAATSATIRSLWDDLFVVSSAEDCANPDLVLGANAETDCGSPQAWGCASFDGRRTRVTFNGTLRANGTMDDRAIQCAIWGHEILHALDLGHTGRYGGEGAAHPHVSSLGFVGENGCPVDNPDGVPPVQDYEDGGGSFRYNLQRRTATPTPTPTPTLTPEPTPPPVPAGQVQVYAWQYNTATGEYQLAGEGSAPAVPGTVVYVFARGGVYLGQVEVNSAAAAATSDRAPGGPVGPR